MQNCEVKPNVISCNSVISSCEKAGEWQQALHFLEYMDTVAVEPSIISYNAAISACEKANHWRQALELFTLASTQTRLAGDVVGVNAALSACAKAAAQTQALSLFRAMPQMKLLPDVISYSTVITGQPWPQVLNLLAAKQQGLLGGTHLGITSCVTGVWPSWPVALELLRAAEHRTPGRTDLAARAIAESWKSPCGRHETSSPHGVYE
ncbi:Pentatricopeptide repeat-containing protein At2g31400 [Durusdinium trenchii]|uniref:Chloroplastic n=1 Tax=Durusdinium trenchii TaxID=1381693 RepID=A0ABP0MD17_9DINO